jgi:hypothetical protein
MDSPVLPHIIQEHAPLSLAKADGWAVLLFGLVYLVTLVSVLPKWPRVTWLLPLVWFYLGCTRVRHAPLFAITAGLAVADMLPHTRWAAMLARRGSDLFQFPAEAASPAQRRFDWRPALAPCCVVLAALLLQTGRVEVPAVGHGWARLDPAYWPVGLRPALERYDHRPGGTAVFNEYLFGGFLIYYTPGYRVFVDDRCELYGDRWLQDYVNAEVGGTGPYIQDLERRYEPFDLALTRTGSGFDDYFGGSGQWVAVERTESATLYRRGTAALTATGPPPRAARGPGDPVSD